MKKNTKKAATNGYTSRVGDRAATHAPEVYQGGDTNIRLEWHGDRVRTATSIRNEHREEVAVLYKDEDIDRRKRRSPLRVSVVSLLAMCALLVTYVFVADDVFPDDAETRMALQPTGAPWTQGEQAYVDHTDARLDALMNVVLEVQPHHIFITENQEVIENGAYDAAEFKQVLVELDRVNAQVASIENVPKTFDEYHASLLTMSAELDAYQDEMTAVLAGDTQALIKANTHLVSASSALDLATVEKKEVARGKE